MTGSLDLASSCVASPPRPFSTTPIVSDSSKESPSTPSSSSSQPLDGAVARVAGFPKDLAKGSLSLIHFL